jgi:outer membrane autotransporter protein
LKLKLVAALVALCAAGVAASAQSTTAAGGTLTAVPLLPSANGTYYYEGYDATLKHVFITTTGTYIYVDDGGYVYLGAPAPADTLSPYRVTINATGTSFQFKNNHPNLFTLVDVPGIDGAVTTATSYAARSGTWFANDVTFTLTSAADSAIWIEGRTTLTSATGFPAGMAELPVEASIENYAGTAYNYVHAPVVFSGTNINAIADLTAANGSRQAISLRNGASAFIYGGTLSRTTLVSDTNASEAIYLVGNQDGAGNSSHFTGTGLYIAVAGGITNGVAAITMANGNNTVTLHSSTIDVATASTSGYRGAITLADTQRLGGNHFYGEDIVITNTATGRFRTFNLAQGENTVTLKNSAITTTSTGAVFGWQVGATLPDRLASTVTLENTTIATTADYAPVFQIIGDRGAATITGGTITTTGAGSHLLRLSAHNDDNASSANGDSLRFRAIITGAVIKTPGASAIDINIAPGDSAHYGEGASTSKDLTTFNEDVIDIVLQSSTLTGAAAMRIAAAGRNNSPYADTTGLFIYDSTFAGGIEMARGDQDSPNAGTYTNGANLTVTASNAILTGGFTIKGNPAARLSHQAHLYVYDSTFTGDITLETRGLLVLSLVNTPLTGDFSLSGSTRTCLDLINSPITGSISLDGTARLENTPGLDVNNRRALIRNSAITGGFNLAGSSAADLTLSGPATVLAGGITAADAATATLRFEDNASLTGGVTLSGNSSVSLVLSSVDQLAGDLVVLDRARLALSTFAGTPINLDRGLTLGGIWSIPGKTTLSGTLALTGSLGTIHLANATTDSLTLASGLTGNGRLDIEAIDGNLVGTDAIHVIHDRTGTFTSATAAPLILSHPVDYGLAAYTLENRADGAWLVGGLDRGSYGAGGAAVFNSTALAAQDWFAALEPLQRHSADLRARAADPGAFRRARFDAGDLWLQSRALNTDVDRSNPALDFTQRTLGLTAGADAHYDLGHSLLATGVFADTATTNRDFINGADGRTLSVGAGLQALWTHRKTGLYATALARFDTHNHTLDTHSPTNAMTADYHTQSGGLALETGWRLDPARLALIPENWWFEPSLALGYAKLAGTTYTTTSNRPGNIIDITLAGAKALQYRLALSAGKTLTDRWSLLIRLAYASVDASGGGVSSVDATGRGVRDVDFTLDGARYEAALGITRRLGRSGRLHLDYTYTSGDDYTRPWTLTLGYSHLW